MTYLPFCCGCLSFDVDAVGTGAVVFDEETINDDLTFYTTKTGCNSCENLDLPIILFALFWCSSRLS